jgi:4-hydroxybenzoate polyprenyltransferase
MNLMFTALTKILGMIRFSHTLFALPFALLAAVMAWTAPAGDDRRIAFRWMDLAGILVCMVCARSAAMAFNRIADRKLDAANPRTCNRHLPAGLLSLRAVSVFTVAASAGFVAGTLLFLPNPLPGLLSVPVLLFLFAYSYAKRFTTLAHFWLGAALMLAPVAVWIALRGEAVIGDPADLLPALVLGMAVLLWVAGFDIIYACQDAEFDMRANLRSVPARFGIAGALRVAAWCHAGMVALLIALPLVAPQLPFGLIYTCGLIGIAALLAYEHWIVRPDDLARVNTAFFHVNWMISTGLFIVGAIDLLT